MARQMTSSQFHKSKSLDNKYMLGDEVGKGAYHHLKRNIGGVNKFLSRTPNMIGEGEGSSGPVKLSKFLCWDKDDERRSVVYGEKILLKVDKSKEDKVAESKRNELLKF